MNKATRSVMNYSDLVSADCEGILLTPQGFEQLIDEVKTAMNSIKNVKESSTLYGNLALNMVGLGEKLAVGKVSKSARRMQEKTKKDFLCIYCKIPFESIERCHRHLIGRHHEEISLKVRLHKLHM